MSTGTCRATNGAIRRPGVLTIFVIAVITLAACSGAANNVSVKSTASSKGARAVAPAADPGIPAIVARVSPSVVTILTADGLGSGVVWAADGTIVTDAHVVAGNDSVMVAFADGRRVSGSVQAADDTTDLAVVKADRSGLPAAKFATAQPPVGGLAIAIGSPLGFANTVSAGVVSGLQRSIPGSAQQGPPLANLVQTDAAISPGDSGGGLLNDKGEVIGINEAYLPPSTGAVSIGFATPASTVQQIVPQLLKNGKAAHPFMGVQVAQLTPDVARQLGVKATQGAVVLSVDPGSPADKAGIQEGDVITAVDSTQVAAVEDFAGALRSHQPGDQVTVKVVRGKSTKTVKVTLAEQTG
jgi:S1-C subfamily serine protease